MAAFATTQVNEIVSSIWGTKPYTGVVLEKTRSHITVYWLAHYGLQKYTVNQYNKKVDNGTIIATGKLGTISLSNYIAPEPRLEINPKPNIHSFELIQTKDNIYRFVDHKLRLLTTGFSHKQNLVKNRDIISFRETALYIMRERYNEEFTNN